MKEIIFDKEAKDLLKSGIDKIANAIKSTIGPAGKLVMYKEHQKTLMTKDGATVAKNLRLDNPYEDMAVQLFKEVALGTNENVGDGTTTASVIAQKLIELGLSENLDITRTELLSQINSSLKIVLKELNKKATLITDNNQIKDVAMISSNNDELIGTLLQDVFREINNKGVIEVEESSMYETTYDIVKGLKYDVGYLSPHFINTDSEEVIYENAIIVLCNFKINKFDDISHILNTSVSKNIPIFIVCNDIDSALLSLLITNRVKNGFNICVIKTPGFGVEKLNNLNDIGIITNSNVFNEPIKQSDLAKFIKPENKISCSKHRTTFIPTSNPDDTTTKINDYIESLKNKVSYEDFKDAIDTRISKILGGVAIIKVGGISQVEMKERKTRIEDAISAVNAALEEGIIAGGGLTLYNISDKLNKENSSIGAKYLYEAISEPHKIIYKNAGIIITSPLYKEMGDNYGYNIKTKSYGDLIEMGIIDPVKVTKTALLNAVSIATMIINTDCVIGKETY